MRKIILLTIGLILYSSTFLAGAAEYEHGHRALQIFDADGFEKAPQWVKIWIGFLLLTFLSGVFFVKNHPIARWVVGGMLVGIAFGMFASSVLGIPTLSGFLALIHLIFWTPALYQLLSKRPFLGPRSAFAIWSGVMTTVILFSFVFDIRDAFIFLRHVI